MCAGLITKHNTLIRVTRDFFVAMEHQKSFDIYVFGDQTYDIQINELRNLLHDGKSDPVVVEFLERARRALRDDLYQLRPEDRHHVPSFACVTELSLWKRGHSVPVDMAMLCLYQLGAFMRYVSALCRNPKYIFV